MTERKILIESFLSTRFPGENCSKNNYALEAKCATEK